MSAVMPEGEFLYFTLISYLMACESREGSNTKANSIQTINLFMKVVFIFLGYEE